MAETDKRRTLTTRLIWFIIAVFFAIMIVSQLVIYLYNPIRTEVASLYTTTETIGFKGIYVRDEKLVSYNISGVINYSHPDGSKIAKNSVIAEVYSSQNDLAIQQEIESLTAQKSVLEDAQALVGTDSSQLESFSNQIYEKQAQIAQFLYDEDYKSASALKEDMLNLQSKKEIVKGAETSYQSKITEIENRIAMLKGQISREPYAISIGETGYFVSRVDGFEDALNSETVFELTKEQIEHVISAEEQETNPSGVIGKLIDGYKWYMVAIFDTVRLGTVFEGANVTLRIGSSQQDVQADIISLERQEDGSSICIFECDMFSSEFVDGRVAQVKLLMDDYEGIRIPTEAIRVTEDGRVGVYVLNGGIEVVFRQIRQIISEEDYTLVVDTTDEEGYISLYDTIIVEGKDLYDGKIIS
ncbi:MAG: hypothetical protein IJ385_05615 [Ruminiclostridium sp.]|nr:hypothetical protein [Ruminiclostridium sp.]